jgi:hypothetical protein
MHFKKIFHKIDWFEKKFENRIAFFIFSIAFLAGFIMSPKDAPIKLFANLFGCGFLAFIINAIIQSIISLKEDIKKNEKI